MLEAAAVAYQQGDEQAFNRLVRELQADLHYRSSSAYVPGYSPEDLQQELLLMLMLAARRFKPEKGVRFRTYFSRFCDRHIKDLRKTQDYITKRANKNTLSLSGMISGDGEEPETYEIADEDFGFNNVETDIYVLQVGLSKVEREVLALYLDGYELREISTLLGGWVTDKGCYAARVLARIRKKLQACMVGVGFPAPMYN